MRLIGPSVRMSATDIGSLPHVSLPDLTGETFWTGWGSQSDRSTKDTSNNKCYRSGCLGLIV